VPEPLPAGSPSCYSCRNSQADGSTGREVTQVLIADTLVNGPFFIILVVVGVLATFGFAFFQSKD